MAFAAVADLAALLAVDFDAEATARASLLLDRASDLVRSYTRQQLDYVADDEVTLPGTWTSELVLPQRPVVAVGSVSVGLLGDLALSAYTWNRAGSVTLGGSPLSFDQMGNASSFAHWGGPSTRITVVYSHGYQSIPGDVAGVALNVAARAWANPTALRDEAVGDYRAAYAGGASTGTPEGGGALYLSNDEQRLLNRYRRRTL